MTTTVSTETHQFVIRPHWRHPDAFEVEFRPLNPKTGKPWQASHRVREGADVQIPGYAWPTAYSTFAGAEKALTWKVAQMRTGKAR